MSDSKPILGFVATVACAIKPEIPFVLVAGFEKALQTSITDAVDGVLKAHASAVSKGEVHLALIDDAASDGKAKIVCPDCGPGPVNYTDPLTCGECGQELTPKTADVPTLPKEDALEALRDQIDEDAIKFDDLDDAIIGYGQQHGTKTVLIYSARKIMECLVKQGMDEKGAQEWFEFNIECLYAGPGTPIIMYDLEAR